MIRYYRLLCVTVTIAFLGCTRNEIEFELPGPSLTISTQLPDEILQEAGNDIFQDFKLQSAKGLQRFEVFLDDRPFESISYDGEINVEYSFLYTIPSDTPNGTRSKFEFVLSDITGEQVRYEINFRVNTTFFEQPDTIGDTPVVRLKGRLNRDYVLEAQNTYVVDSVLSVENNSVLTVEAGSTVYFTATGDPNNQSKLVITRGSKITAEGTAENPIVFTSERILRSEEPSPADWDGLVVYGFAPNNEAAVVLDEGFRYGGDQPNDNSGVLRYLRIEYAGNVNDNSQHALRLYGVGAATQVDHIHIFRNYNIGIRLRGGRVNLKYIAAIGHGGYGLWADRGWQGKGQFWLFQTDVQATLVPVNYWNIARSVEMRNDADNFLKNPRTTFTISNVTCIGNGYQEGIDTGTRRGVRLRTGAIGSFQNAIITGFPNDAARVEDLDIEVLGVDMIFDNIRSFDNANNYEQEARTVFFEDPNDEYNVTDDPVAGISLTNFIGSEPSPFDPATMDNFFTSAPYIGAVENASNDWTSDGNWFKDIDGNIR